MSRDMLPPAHRFGEEHFTGEGGPLLIADNALHTDLAPESAPGGGFGWLMCTLGQLHGFPVPVGGAGGLTDALVRRLRARGAVLGQMTTADPTRSPAGTESARGYTRVPQRIRSDAGDDGILGSWSDREKEVVAARVEAGVELLAPGFRSTITARRVLAPPDLERLDPALVGGAVNQGTTRTRLHQQLLFRPLPGTGRPGTPVRGLCLASATAHPGGGVHGAPGAHAARAALRALHVPRRAFRRSTA